MSHGQTYILMFVILHPLMQSFMWFLDLCFGTDYLPIFHNKHFLVYMILPIFGTWFLYYQASNFIMLPYFDTSNSSYISFFNPSTIFTVLNPQVINTYPV